MKGVWDWFVRVMACVSQTANVVFLNGHPNETISGRCYREGRTEWVEIIDAIFFFDPEHCLGSYLKDYTWAVQTIKDKRL